MTGQRRELRLIVHGDDFGLSAPVNRGIVEAHRDGILTSTSVIACGAAFDHAISELRSTPTLDVGVHLTLVEERPLRDPARIPTLVTSDRRFHRSAGVFARRYMTGRISLGEVREELDAQVAKVVNAGLAPSHLDSHQHLHALPGIMRVVVDLARRHGLGAIRIPRERIRPGVLGPSGWRRLPALLALRLSCLAAELADLRGGTVAAPDTVIGFPWAGNLDERNLRRAIAAFPASGTCELMCHPGLDDPGGAYGHWGYRWPEEHAALTDPAVARRLEDRGIRLISYRDLADD